MSNDIKISLIIAFIAFVLVLLLDYYMVLLPKSKMANGKKKKKNSNNTISEIEYLKSKFKLSSNDYDLKFVIRCISVINAFIISFSSFVIMMIPLSFIWQLLIGFALVFGLIYSCYELFGRYLVKKGKIRQI